jgi:hypothetical protein
MQENTLHPIRPFTDLLRELGEGSVLDDLSAKMNALVEAVQNEHKQGTLMLTLTLKPAQNSALAMLVVPEVRIKKPEPELVGTIMFPTEDCNLVRDNPRQTKMELKAVTETTTPLRDVQ